MREQQVQFHIVSFEGPDDYARAGGIASRVVGLARALADAGFETHLWFVGDPGLPGHEGRGRLKLHRWCQWISHYHPGGVYDGEEGKRRDFSSSLPPFLVQKILLPHLKKTDGHAVILAEEWQVVDAVLHLDWLLRCAGLRERVRLLWNANNTFGFERIDWGRLAEAAVITTVSRYMRYRMWNMGVDPLVIPNGLSPDDLQQPEGEAVDTFRQRLRGRTVLGKVARWHPDKRWLMALRIVIELKRQGKRPLLIARGGVEAHAAEVFAHAAADQLRVAERNITHDRALGLPEILDGLEDVDVVNIRSPLGSEARSVLLQGADAILANSVHEPFGLVGLETMAVGGVACTGATGEDYAVPGWNAIVLQSADPLEFLTLFQRLQSSPAEASAMRRHGRSTARQYVWPAIIQRSLLPRLRFDDGEDSTRPE